MADRNVPVEGEEYRQPGIDESKYVVGREEYGERDGVVVDERFPGQVPQRPQPEARDEDQGIGDGEGLEHRRDGSEFSLAHVAEDNEGDQVAENSKDGDGGAEPDLDDVPQEDDARVLVTPGYRRRPGVVGVGRGVERSVVWEARVTDGDVGNVLAVHGPLLHLGSLLGQAVTVGLRGA